MSAKTISASLAMLGLTPLAMGVGGTLEFEDLTDGTTYFYGQSFVTEGITVDVLDFGGNSGGSAQVDNPNQAGSGNGMFTENSKLDFQFPFPLTIVGFSFAHFGGDVRLCVNGAEVVGTDFIDFHGMNVGGASVSVTGIVRNSYGFVTIQGNLTQFAVGSEDGEFDDVRYVVPAPGAAGLLALGALGVAGRRRR